MARGMGVGVGGGALFRERPVGLFVRNDLATRHQFLNC